MRSKKNLFIDTFIRIVSLLKRYGLKKVSFSSCNNNIAFLCENYNLSKYFVFSIGVSNCVGLYLSELSRNIMFNVDELYEFLSNNKKNNIVCNILHTGLQLQVQETNEQYLMEFCNTNIKSNFYDFCNDIVLIRNYECTNYFIENLYSLKKLITINFGENIEINNENGVKLIILPKYLNLHINNATHIFSLFKYNEFYVVLQSTDYFNNNTMLCNVKQYYVIYNF